MKIFNGNRKRSLISSGLFKKCGILILSLALIGCGSSSKEDKSSQATPSISKSEQTTQVESLSQEAKANEDSPLEMARFYSDNLHWSEAEIYDYLKEHYTLKEANETLQALGADFKQNALERAKDLATGHNMSKEGIRQDLEFAQFTPEEIQYAMNNLGDVDFKENALIRANTMTSIEGMAFSKAYTYKDLTDEDGLELFTPEEAQYAVDHVEADFNQNALKRAKWLLNEGRSKENIKEVLEDSLLFTPEEAQYAIDHLD